MSDPRPPAPPTLAPPTSATGWGRAYRADRLVCARRRAADVLNDDALVRGCELHACADEEDVDA